LSVATLAKEVTSTMDFFGLGGGLGSTAQTPAEKHVGSLLFDDAIQVLSSFELNQIASLSYGDLVCDQIFEIIEKVVAQPLNYTAISTQKALAVTKHILIYGSEKCVNSAYGIGNYIDGLQQFNTVLMAHQQQGAMAMLARIQGGGVDKGGPVRDAATAIHKLLSNINELKRIRNASADPNSLVPVGDDKIAFVTDEVRHYLLNKRIDEQKKIHIKSNLAKANGGFGGGYMSKDGNAVVGAAHGIEEMLKEANKEKLKYSDEGRSSSAKQGFSDYSAPDIEEYILEELSAGRASTKTKTTTTTNADFLGLSSFQSTPQFGDLLDFGGPSTVNVTGDLLGGTDFLGTASTEATQSNDLLGLAMQPPNPLNSAYGTNNDVFGALPTTAATPPATAAVGPFGLESQPATTGMSPGGVTSSMTTMAISSNNGKRSVMSSNEDRFAALDALGLVNSKSGVSKLAATSAENRILGFTGSTTGTSPLSELPSPPQAMASPMVEPGSGAVAATYYGESADTDDNPWVMGGATGSGLRPLGPAPSLPPPPPPSSP
jgi:hypothetical protein